MFNQSTPDEPPVRSRKMACSALKSVFQMLLLRSTRLVWTQEIVVGEGDDWADVGISSDALMPLRQWAGTSDGQQLAKAVLGLLDLYRTQQKELIASVRPLVFVFNAQVIDLSNCLSHRRCCNHRVVSEPAATV